MARESQPARTGLTLALNKDIWRANFYRFCQLLEQENPDAPKLGATSHPGDDPVRFRPWPGMGFPVSTLKAVETDEDHPTLPPTVRTTFLGMYGVDSLCQRPGWTTLRSAAKDTRRSPRFWIFSATASPRSITGSGENTRIRPPSRPVGEMPHHSVCWGWWDSVYRVRLSRWQRRFPVSWPCWAPCVCPPAMPRASGLW
jgi:hypothetical protein